MCVIISIQDSSISLSKSIKLMVSSQDFLFSDIISFQTSSFVRGTKHLTCGMSLTVVGILLYW